MIEFVQAYERDETVTIKRRGPKAEVPTLRIAANGRAMWETLFPFPPEEVDPFFPDGLKSHIDIKDNGFTYRWPGSLGSMKRRPIVVKNGLKHYWESGSTSDPPFWPEPPEVLEETIYFTEGETDCIVARWLGLPAFALTKGASTPICNRLIKDLSRRGVRNVYLLFDDDSTGRTVAKDVENLIGGVSMSLPKKERIECRTIEIGDMLLPMYGEKDIRQAALRLRDSEALSLKLQDLKKQADSIVREEAWLTGQEFLRSTIPPTKWVVENILSPEAFSMITGFPKMGKSYLSLDLAISIATGTSFLNHFPVYERGDVLYIAKETTAWDLQDRYRKMSLSKAPMSVWTDNDVPWETEEPQVHFLLRSDFRFDPAPMSALQDQILDFQSRSGRHLALVIVDPFSYCMPTGKFDLNSYGDYMSRVATPTKQIINSTGTAFLLVVHQGKGEGLLALGSTAIEGAYTNKIFYRDKERTPGAPIGIGVSHRDSTSFGFDLDPGVSDETYNPKVLDEAEPFSVKITKGKEEKVEGVGTKILLCVPEGEFSFKDLETRVRESFSATDISYSLLTKAFDFLVKESGQIEKIRHGFYKKTF